MSSRHYHLMGIGGISVSALAEILLWQGHRVSGCDRQLSERTAQLAQKGIRVFEGHHPGHLEGVDVLVASTAIDEEEPELAEARRRRIRVLRRIELLGEIMGRGESLGVTGSHGKTSTSAMLAQILLKANLDPTVVLGADFAAIGGNYRIGSGPIVAEVDESDPLFQHLKLSIAVITNLEADHISPDGLKRPNYHQSFESLKQAVRTFAQGAARVVYNAEWEHLEALTAGTERYSFGLAQGDCHAASIELLPFGSRFALVWQGKALGQLELRVPGKHNIANALAAATAALVMGVPFAAIRAALEDFAGARRRFERVGEWQGALVVDDYAHNATKLSALLAAARATGLRVRVVFQPHRYGRSEQEWPGYARALEQADEVLLLDVYAASEQPIRLTSAQIVGNIVEHLEQRGRPARHYAWEEALAYLRHSAQPGDLILTVGAGSVSQLGHLLVSPSKEVV
ncbi:UDP-N-acetylmuramate--L-alanine ligase [Calidithermus roseus]|uniref:UDP-N-acetylmuramate--L-alanine ligase n=1 Tax=Calidithermus roseus TaxID=1644118 RepID=A0A399EET0_9DEIN|nr:UDP-N-acetylmuramate--L-alanine ligase [Calidithermus roseus]RIH82835.1 UDP-N-acetylmuramate--L-alanine ligase [Calidithermus roseus]